jgi:hypothetical protein
MGALIFYTIVTFQALVVLKFGSCFICQKLFSLLITIIKILALASLPEICISRDQSTYVFTFISTKAFKYKLSFYNLFLKTLNYKTLI